MAKIIAVCTSDSKGTKKEEVAEGTLQENYGLIGDAHAAHDTHRQVSLLAISSLDKMRGLGLNVNPGDFAENLTCESIALCSLPIGTRISIGNEAVLEVTQIGKECHSGCDIFRQVGKCVMPKEGVFARVIRSGVVRAGDIIRTGKDGDRGSPNTANY